jgi:hypothetical protein
MIETETWSNAFGLSRSMGFYDQTRLDIIFYGPRSIQESALTPWIAARPTLEELIQYRNRIRRVKKEWLKSPQTGPKNKREMRVKKI